jgi:ankyrin repeat protein
MNQYESSSMSSNDWESALQKSLVSGHENVALFLLQNYIKISDQESYTKTVEQASQAGIFKVVQWLIKAYPSFSKANVQTKLLDMAIMKGQLSFLKRYCLKGQLPDNSVANGACFGHVDIVSFCLDEGASIEKEGPLGAPLRAASLMGHEMAVRLLIARGADINASGKFGDALQAAAINDHRSITHFLIQNKADVNAQGGYYGNSLQAAASRGHREVAEALINAGARISDKGRYENAFFAAAEAGHHAVVGLFIEKGFQFPRRYQRRYKKSVYTDLLRGALTAAQYGLPRKPDERLSLPIPGSGLEESFKTLKGNIFSNSHNLGVASEVQDLKIPAPGECSSLVSAASKGWDLVVQYMVAERTKIRLAQDDLELALREAAYRGHIGIVKILLESDIEKTWKTSNALMAAAQNGYIAIIQMLIQHETDLDSLSHENALLIAKHGSRGNQISSVRYCLSQVPDEDKRVVVASAFKQAAKFNGTCILKSFLQHGDYVEEEVVRQAFQIAASNSSTDVVQFLLASSYANCMQSEHHLVAFRAASFYGHAALAQLLLDHVSSPCSPEYLRVLFINAAYKGYRGVLKVLVPEIRKLDCCQTLLDMCLCFTCAEGQFNAASFLIDAGASVTTRVDKTMEVDEDPALVGLCLDEDSDEDRSGRKGGTRRKLQSRTRYSRRFVYYKYGEGQWTALQACLQSPRQFQFPQGDREEPQVLASKHIAVLQLLISQNVDVNMPSGDGHTPLHWAVSREIQCSPMVSLLLNAGAEFPSMKQRPKVHAP